MGRNGPPPHPSPFRLTVMKCPYCGSRTAMASPDRTCYGCGAPRNSLVDDNLSDFYAAKADFWNFMGCAGSGLIMPMMMGCGSGVAVRFSSPTMPHYPCLTSSAKEMT